MVEHVAAPMPYPYQEGTTLSRAILTAIRQHPQLKGSLKFTAQEIAHRASGSGFVRVSYGYLASKTGLTIQTMITHVKRLEALGILRKQKVWISARRCAVNLYTLLIRPLHKCATQKHQEKLPEQEREEEKALSLRDEIAQLERGMRLLTPGSVPYMSCMARVEVLRAMQHRSSAEMPG